MGNGAKKWYASKTLWFIALFVLVQFAGIFGYADFTPDSNVVEYINLGAAVIMAILRAVTKVGVEL